MRRLLSGYAADRGNGLVDQKEIILRESRGYLGKGPGKRTSTVRSGDADYCQTIGGSGCLTCETIRK